jgi:PAS domain S-box-containing protein
MDPRQEQGVADLRGLPRKARETSNRFADEDLRLQNQQLLSSRDALERERQKYFELFEFAPDAYFITDAHGVIREANVAASQLLGVPSQFLVGKRLPNYFEESARKAYRHQLNQLCGSERAGDWEINVQAANRDLTAVSISIGQIAQSNGRTGGYRWILRDITKRKQAELAVRELNRDLQRRVAARTEQLAAANRLKDTLLASERKAREDAEISNRVKSDFLALLSHEFRTPLQAIFGYTELLEREIHGPLNDSQRRDVSRIQQSEQHLLGLITAILDFAKLESGQPMDLSLQPTLVHEVLVHLEGLVGPQLEEKELHYEYRCDDPSIIAYADAAKVQQIVLNLLANAIKFTDQGGSITLTAELEADAIAIRVSDTGRGIPSDKLDAVFQPFVQIRSQGSVANGTGLGLPISQRLANAMGGSLTATSELGQGSTFTLRLQRPKSS